MTPAGKKKREQRTKPSKQATYRQNFYRTLERVFRTNCSGNLWRRHFVIQRYVNNDGTCANSVTTKEQSEKHRGSYEAEKVRAKLKRQEPFGCTPFSLCYSLLPLLCLYNLIIYIVVYSKDLPYKKTLVLQSNNPQCDSWTLVFVSPSFAPTAAGRGVECFGRSLDCRLCGFFSALRHLHATQSLHLGG